jgi:hypothetical protein
MIAEEQSLRADRSWFGRPADWLMEMLRGYWDDSGKEDDPQNQEHCCVLAGYAGPLAAWAPFEARWQGTLDKHKVPYLHMKEINGFTGPFTKWKNDPAGRAAFMADLVRDIGESSDDIYCVASAIRLPDLWRFNDELGLAIDAYALAIYGCQLELFHLYEKRPVEMIIDQLDKRYRILEQAEAMAKNDRYYAGVTENISINVLSGASTSRNVLPVQAADFAAWEFRKSHATKSEWFAAGKRGENPTEWIKSLEEWEENRFGTRRKERKSFTSLLQATYTRGIVWDYRALRIAHRARGGVWY